MYQTTNMFMVARCVVTLTEMRKRGPVTSEQLRKVATDVWLAHSPNNSECDPILLGLIEIVGAFIGLIETIVEEKNGNT